MMYEEKDLEAVSKLREQSEEFVKLENEHGILNRRVEEFEKNKYLSPDEEVLKKECQKKKLRIKDQLNRMIMVIKAWD